MSTLAALPISTKIALIVLCFTAGIAFVLWALMTPSPWELPLIEVSGMVG